MCGNQVLDHPVGEAHVGPCNVIIFTAAEPRQIKQLLRHLTAAIPHAKLSLLYEIPRPPLPIETEGRQALKSAPSPGYIRSAFLRSATGVRAACIGLLDCLLRRLHAAPEFPNAKTPDLHELQRYAEASGVSFRLTEDFHSQTSLEFVRRMNPDLGVVYRTRARANTLFAIPKRGSINLHDQKLPDGRECPPGLRELKDGPTEQTVSVHRVVAEDQAGAVLGQRTFPLEEYDTPESIAIKADLLGIECLVDVIRSETSGGPGAHPPGSSGAGREAVRTHNGPRAVQPVRRNRNRFRPAYGRPLFKLLARFLFYPRVWLLNRRRSAKANFPIVMLFGHVIADRPHFMGISSHQFLKQVKFLKKHYHIASLPDAIEMLREGKVSAPTVVLTFDDGYEVNHLGLRAVIDSEEIPVALFVCTENVGEHRPFDHDLKRGESDFLPLTWDQLKDFERQGSTIGSHTRTHFDCGSTDEGLLREEIAGAGGLAAASGARGPLFLISLGIPEKHVFTCPGDRLGNLSVSIRGLWRCQRNPEPDAAGIQTGLVAGKPA